MKEVYFNLFSILFGTIMVLNRNFLAKKAVSFQKKFFNYEVNEIGYKIGYFVGGVVFIIIGILSLFGII